MDTKEIKQQLLELIQEIDSDEQLAKILVYVAALTREK